MAKSGDTITAYARLLTPAGDALSYADATAFEAASWSFTYAADGTIDATKVYTCAVMSGDLGTDGWHKFTWTAQDAAEHVWLRHATNEAWPAHFAGGQETYDLDGIADVVVSPIVSVVSAGGPQGDINLRACKSDYAPISFTVRDQSGAAINLSSWTGAKFGVKSKDQTATVYAQTTAITMSSAGLVTVEIPENATVWAALATGADEAQLRFSFEADQGGDATKTRTLARGPFTVMRKETL